MTVAYKSGNPDSNMMNCVQRNRLMETNPQMEAEKVPGTREHVWFFDLLRCLAAIAVVAIHVLGPYREQLGQIPFTDWSVAVLVNGASRWAVPVFIMITGA